MAIAGKRIVLVVEDDPVVLRVTARIVEALGYETAATEDIDGAVALVRQHGKEATCVLVDYSLKSGTGLDAIRKMREFDAELPVIMLSGFAQQDIESNVDGPRWTGFLQKPYSVEELREAIATYRRA
jgi:CheY-like chemotaxis protein